MAVIGATERPGSWGSFIMEGLLSWEYQGRIYPVNPKGGTVFGYQVYPHVREIPDPVELAILTIPEEHVEAAIRDCGEKGIKGVTIITAGYAEAVQSGREREEALKRMAHRYGMRLLGPNVSGTMNLHARFNAAASPSGHLCPTPLAAVCQGGYAFYDLLALGFPHGMGVGQFIHTGNECDLTVTDFLEYFGNDPEVQGVLMYLETIRDGKDFLDVVSRVCRDKPVIVYKAGRTAGGSRAAASHTGALAGRRQLFEGMLQQAGVVMAPTMELLVPVGHALIERPPMRGNRVAIVTMGGSWGVVLSDTIEEQDLCVPELSPALQKSLRDMGMPERASTRNPVDIGASGLYLDVKTIVDIGEIVLASGEVDALVLHGVGRPGMLCPNTPEGLQIFMEIEKQVIMGYSALESRHQRPVVIGNPYSIWESQVVADVVDEGIRTVSRIDDIAHMLRLLYHARKRYAV
ncbi:MAG: acetate--CoA ligase family protein [Desulfomonilia bacterium]